MWTQISFVSRFHPGDSFLQVYAVLSYASVHCLDQSGRSVVDSGHLHLLHLVTVAHLIQILLTSTTGVSHLLTPLLQVCDPELAVCLPPSHPCVLPAYAEEVCMDQDIGRSEEEELTCQLYSTLRKHLGG